ncbi:glycosyltransferase family A protein [Sinorhizobium sp. BG8]|uniref:glycosyltransferase family 2 protein n=1 Tax=Sinorhizobium sp. BG8 TaxID=2613773 RepID=UPI00193DF7A7|nr:glycosyltransferase family A protein [Sinorhizobium sp. BG8]QRM56397.1 glycosyltransferase family 2 protein [Sinorhizobium sp. BG8]
MATTVDVVIPCYKYGRYLRECVESVLAQEGVAVRMLILDDASPDDSAEVAQELARQHPEVEFCGHATNKGHIATYNEGIEWASGDLFLLLSADDYLLPGAFSRAAEMMATTADMSFTFGNATMLFDDGSRIASEPFGRGGTARTTVLPCVDFLKAMEGRNIVPTPTAVVRTEMQKRIGGYSSDLPHSGDMAMWMRLAAEGPVGFINTPQSVYRIHSRNMSHSYSSPRLPDIQQRQAAIEHFLEHCGSKLPTEAFSNALLFHPLGREATRQASAAFNEGEVEISRELSRIARKLYPGIWHTAPWLRLQINRAVGPRAWSALRSAYRGS